MKRIIFAKVKRKIGCGLTQIYSFGRSVPEIIRMDNKDYNLGKQKGITVCLEYELENNTYIYKRMVGRCMDSTANSLSKLNITNIEDMGKIECKLICTTKKTIGLHNVKVIDGVLKHPNYNSYILLLKRDVGIKDGDILSGKFNLLKIETINGVFYALLHKNLKKIKNKIRNKE